MLCKALLLAFSRASLLIDPYFIDFLNRLFE